jgi:general secretion pathway protein F
MDGEVIEGVMEASSEDAALDRLKNAGVIPIRLAVNTKDGGRKKIGLKSRKRNLLTFTTELSALLTAGLPLDRALNILSAISESKEMKDIVRSILTSIREGNSFSEALRKHPHVFPVLYINMIRAGEAGGVLGPVLDKLNEFLETSNELRDHVVSAMIYPAILGVTGGISIILLLTFVLPRFSVIFSELGGSLPITTQVLLAFSGALRVYWWMGAVCAGVIGFAFRMYVRSDAGSLRWDAMKLKLMDDIIRKLETARFCRTLGTLLQSGISVLQALNNARDVIGNRIVALGIDRVSKGAKEGRGIAGPLVEANVFPPLALSMIKVGEETGQLDLMLLRVAGTYEKSLKESVRRFVGLLEPAMILTMGLVIGFIVISMLMAIFSITDLPF